MNIFISKNIILIIGCAASICLLVYSILLNNRLKDCQNDSLTQTDDFLYGTPGISGYLDDEIDFNNSQHKVDSLNKVISQLKKKVNYYFEFYRKNQPGSMTIERDIPMEPLYDTIRFGGGTFIFSPLTTSDSSHIFYFYNDTIHL